MSVLITGGAGFIGSHLAERLVARGEAVVVLDNFDPFYPRQSKESNLASLRDHHRFTLVEGDIRDQGVLDGLPSGIDSVIHLAALAGVRPSITRPQLCVEVNVSGTAGLLELARSRGIGAFIFGSSSSVYGNNQKVPFAEEDPVDHPISPYAATKKAGELLCHTSFHLHGISCLCLRLFTVYGPRQRPDLAIRRFAELMQAGKEIPLFGDGTSLRDYTFIEDIIQGILAALDRARAPEPRFEVFNLGSNRSISLEEMVETLAETMGLEPRIQWLPEQPGDVDRTEADITKARKLLGYQPTTSFRAGIRSFLHWLEQEKV